MRKIKRFLSALLCGAILITGTLAGVSVRTDAAASSYAVQLRAAGFPDSYIQCTFRTSHMHIRSGSFRRLRPGLTGIPWSAKRV